MPHRHRRRTRGPSRTFLGLILTFLLVLALGLYAAAVTIPNVFTAGEPIVADEVNENFEVLAGAVQERALPIEVVTTDGYLSLYGDFEIEVELGIE